MLQNQRDVIEIKTSEFNSKSVEALHKFIYTSEITADENAMDYFEVASKFKVAVM